MYKICFYVPESHLEQVKKALFDKGAGKIGDYDQCSWETLGMGQYRPLEASNPYQGQPGAVSREREYQVEMVCKDNLISDVLHALIEIHPYETPAYSAWKIIQLKPNE